MNLRARLAAQSVAVQILLLQVVVVAAVVSVGSALALADARGDQRREAETATLLVAHTVATTPDVVDAVADADPTVALQPYALAVQRQTGTDFIVIMSTAGRRWTHPDPAQIGGTFRGTIAGAVEGRDVTEEYAGTLGPSVRSVVPVRRDGQVVALVGVGITTERLSRSFWPSLLPIGLAALAVLAVGTIGAALVSRRVRRQTGGLPEQELARMLDYHDAVLHSVREGIVLVGLDHRVRLVNDEARRLLGADPEVGQPVGPELPEALAATMASPRDVRDEWHLVGDRILVVNHTTARWRGRALGTVTTLRDRTELQAATRELDSVRGLADALHAQVHESGNRMHTVVSLMELGRTDEAIGFATGELERGGRLDAEIAEQVGDPVVAALLLGKTAQATERGAELRLGAGSRVEAHTFDEHDLLTLLGNLVDNALDAALGTADRRPAVVQVDLQLHGPVLRLAVEDSGGGVDPADRDQIVRRGWSTKSTDSVAGRGLGLALVLQTVRRLGGRLEIGESPLGGARFVVVVGER
ncbi:sensor histidine kinase [Microlunatus flavus]|uniref:histidine kinase n=1 Tax=Microlunatus flavus TaxID=1036181 RepID=A0A1H9C3E6_9ACTN|nr:sensor histidine kinase [Microlunatus flavus]SEP95497.1 Sensor histidine kinase regulating citrate/malate metabolism [Microlunatus flavus]